MLLIETGKSGGGAVSGLADECVLRHVEADLPTVGPLGLDPATVQLGKISTSKNTSKCQQPSYQNQIPKPCTPRSSPATALG